MLGATDPSALLSSAGREAPDRLALVEAAGRRLTWRELDEQVSRVASGYAGAGVVAGNRIVIAAANRVEFITSYLATLRTHAIAVPVNPGTPVSEMTRVLADTGARVVVADPSTLETVRAAVAALGSARDTEVPPEDPAAEPTSRAVLPLIVVIEAESAADELDFTALLATTPAEIPPSHDPERLAALLYTSGSSGLPRAAMLTHRALAANIEQVAAVEPAMFRPDDVVLCVLPLFHVYALNAVLGAALRHRCKLVLAERFDPEETLDLIDDEACTVVPIAPPAFAHWATVDLADRLSPVRLMLSGSAPLSRKVADEFTERTGIPIHQGYGLTEAAPVVTSTLHAESWQPGSVGCALQGVEIRLAGESGGPVEGDDPGQIAIKGPNLFSGYWPDGSDGPDEHGWWNTGDVGFLDASGQVYLVDRVDELVIVSGFNVYPVEVERVIRRLPEVAEAGVIGVDDEVTGQAVVAYVVPTSDAGASDDVEAAVRDQCEALLARFKVPSRIEVVAELPRTVTGKVQKGRLRGIERRRVLGLVE